MESNSIDSDSEDRSALEKLLLVWSQLSTPVKEKEIVGTWFANIYQTKKTKKLLWMKMLMQLKEDV